MSTKIEIYILNLIRKSHYRRYRRCMREQVKGINEGRFVGAEQWTIEANRHLAICRDITSKIMEIAL